MADPFHVEEQRRAFNQGCDDRLNGRVWAWNPYESDTACWRQWRNGWMDVHKYWAKNVNGRWRFRALPAISPSTATA